MKKQGQKYRARKASGINRQRQNKNYKLKTLAGYIRATIILPAGILLANNNVVFAGPEGGQIVGGQGSINTPDVNTTLVHQQSQNMAVEWQSFNVQSQELVRFQQPSASSAVLNRILDQNPSQIFGTIEANGRVFLVNPNGILFSPTASVNVGSLIAAGLDMDTVKFMHGHYEMGVPEGVDAGVVINRGMIQAATGGSVTLVGGAVSNEGLIIADVGYVNLASGRKAVVDFDGNGLIHFQVDESVLENTSGADASVNNSGEIRAEGGSVVMSGHTARDIFSQVVNNQGIVRAGSIDNTGGTIRLTGFGGPVANSGTLDASGANGGAISISGENIDHSGSINADGSAGNGGSVELFSADTTLVTGNGTISARSESAGQGGSIKVLGDKVSLLDNASLDASGELGGGEILVGGDFQGKNSDVPNATHTYMSSNVNIKANAISEGNGGKVILWSDDTTEMHGHIGARGGELAGNGGFVEISGKKNLIWKSVVDLSAPSGSSGTLYLDPALVEICDGGDVTCSDDGSTMFEDQLISTQLGSSNVTITTGGTVDGDITFIDQDGGTGDGLSITWSANTDLTLTADDDVSLQGIISGSNVSADININFGQDNTNSGLLSINGATLSAGGNIAAVGGTGNDTIDISGSGGGHTVDLETNTISGILTTFLSVESFTGAAAGTDILQVADAAVTINVTGAYDGNVDNTVTFTDVGIVQAGTGGDSFFFGASGSLVTVTGGAGSDAINIAAAGGSNTVDLETGAIAGIAGGFSSIESFTGAAFGTDVLQVADAATTINITGVNDGNVGGTVDFTDFGIVQAGTGGDSFVFGTGGSLVTVSGGAGSDVIDIAAAGGSNTVDLGTSSVVGVVSSFAGIESFTGAALGTDVLQVADAATTINVTGVNDGSVDGTVDFTDFGIVQAGTGGDSFVFGAGGSLVTVIGGVGIDVIDISVAGGSHMVNLETSAITGVASGFSSIENFTGDNSSDVLQLANADQGITIDGANDGSVGGVTYTNFANLVGGAGDDSFTIAGGSFGTIDGGAHNTGDSVADSTTVAGLSNIESVSGTGTLAGGTTYVINGADAGIANGINFTGYDSLSGTNASYAFTNSGTGFLSGTIADAGSGMIDLSAAADGLTVNLEKSSISTVLNGGALGGFTGIGAFTGNAAGTDILQVADLATMINVTGANDGNVDGTVDFTDFGTVQAGTGGDSFVFGAGGSLVAATGGVGTDVIDISVAGGSHTVNLETSAITGVAGSFSSIENFTGDNSSDVLQLANADQGITIDGANDGSVTGGPIYTDFANLVGGAGDDSFTIAGGSFGTIDGGAHNTGDSVADSNTVAGLSNIESVTGTGTLAGGTTYVISGVDAGTANGINFTGYDGLSGTNASYAFTNPGTGVLSDTIADAGSGMIDLSAAADGLTVNLEDSSISTVLNGGALGGFSGIGAFTGNAAGTDILQVADLATMINVTGANDGNVDGTVTFTDFGIVQAGTNGNSFVFGAGGSLVTATGGAGSDVVDIAAAGGSHTVNLGTSAIVGVVSSFTGIESFTGAALGTDILQVADLATTINVTGANDGNVDGSVNFTDFGIVQAGTGGDSFVFGAGGSLVTVTGGAGSDVIDIAVAGGSNRVDLETGAIIGVAGSFSNIENFTGDNGSDTLQVANAATTINVTGVNDGNVDGTVNFTDFGIVQAGTNGDSFVFGAGGSLGTVTGGAGSDVINIAAITGSQIVDLEASAIVGVVGGFSSIESFTGAALGADVLQIADAATTINVTGVNDGNVDGTVSFTDFGIIQAGMNGDSFVFGAGGSLVTATGGAGSDVIDIAAAGGSNTVDLETGAIVGVAGGFSSIESFTGAALGTDVLQVADAATTINVTGPNDGNVDGTVTFTDFGAIQAGTNGDNFVFSAGGSLVTVTGGAGSDVIDIAAAGGSNTVDLGTATITGLVGGFSNIESFTGTAAGTDILQVADAATTINVTDANDGNVDGTVTFTDFGRVRAGTNGDSFVFGADGSLVMATGGVGADVIDISAAGGSHTVNLETSAINGVVSIFTSIESFTGDYSSDTLQVADGGQNVTISGANDGSVTGGPSYTDFANLLGGSGNDAFVLQSGGGITGTVNGGGGINTLVGSTLADTISIDGSTSGNINGTLFTGFSVFSGDDGDDNFIIDLSSIGSFDISLNGASGSDSLLLQNGSHSNVLYNYIDSDISGNNGEITLDSLAIGFTGLDPIINTGSATNIVFNLPDVTVNTVILQNDVGVAGSTELVGTTFENTSFANPLNSLIINLGDLGDTLNLAGADTGFDAALSVNGGAGADSVTHTGDLGALNGFSITAESINLNQTSLITSGDDIALQGAVVLGSPVISVNSAGGDIQFGSTIDSAGNGLVLDAGSIGSITLSGELVNGGDLTVIDGAVQTYQVLSLNSLEIQNGTTVTLNDNVQSAGSISVTGAGVNLNGTSYQSTTGGAIEFVGAVNLNAAGLVTIQTAGALADDITFTGPISSLQPLTLDAGSSGIVNLQGAVNVPGLNVSAGSAFLTDAGNAFSSLSLMSGTASVHNTIALTLADSTLTGQLDLTNNLGITLSQVSAAGQNVNLSAGGAILDGNGVTNNVTASALTISGGNAVTDLETTVASLSLTTAATSINNSGALTLGDSILSGQLDLSNDAGITLNELSVGGQTVNLSAGGAIDDGNGTANNVTASALTISGGNPVTDLETVVSSLTLNTASASISNSGVLTLQDSTLSGQLDLSNDVGITLNQLSATGQTVNLNAGGTIIDGAIITASLLTTSSVGGTVLDLAHQLDSFSATNTISGNVELNDQGNLDIVGISNTVGNTTITSSGMISDSGTINTDLLTTSSVGGTVLDLDHQIDSFSASNIVSGNVELNDQDNLDIAGISNAVGNTTITSSGAITDSGNIQTVGLVISSVNGAVLDGSHVVSNFTATNTTDGDIRLNNTRDSLNLVSVNNQGSGNIVINNIGETISTGAITANSGSITLLANSPLTIGSNGVSASGSITLEAGGESPDNLPNTGDLVTLNGLISSTSGDIRITGADAVIQNANLSSGAGTVRVFADDGDIVMAQGVTTTTSGSEIVYTADGDVTVAVLDTGPVSTSHSTITVTAINGNVKATSEDANIKGLGATANIYALGDNGSIGTADRPLKFQQPDVDSISLGFNGTAYISGQGNEVITSPVEILRGVRLTYDTSTGEILANRTVFGGTLTDISAVTRELSSQVQSAGQSEFEDVSSVLLKSAIKIHNVIGAGIKLPSHQLEEDDEGELTYYFRGFKLINGLALEGMEGQLASPHIFHKPVSSNLMEQGKY